MRIGLIPPPHANQIRHRLERLRVPVFTLEPARIQELAAESAEIVYLIPHSELAAGGWNGLRVQLAHASRQFIVLGEKLSTAEIIAALRDGAALLSLNNAVAPDFYSKKNRRARNREHDERNDDFF